MNTVGNPDLKPEESISYETGLYYENDAGLNANITGFYTEYKNKIVSYSIDDNTNSYTNSGKARTDGVEFASTFPLWSDVLTLSLNYTYTQSKAKDGDNKGAPLSYTPKHMANARLNWQATEDMNAGSAHVIAAKPHALPKITTTLARYKRPSMTIKALI